jgi:hypothetical protein
MRKTPFFRRKLPQIAENCDHNIDPWSLPQIEAVLFEWCDLLTGLEQSCKDFVAEQLPIVINLGPILRNSVPAEKLTDIFFHDSQNF